MTGRFIVFEGGEGTGKSTQSARLARELEARGIGVTLTREPGGTPAGEAVRELLLRPIEPAWSPMAEALLLNAARAMHSADLIRPALSEGRWVISDRYVDSTFAYQGGARGLAVESLRTLHELACGALWPDLVIVLDMPVERSLARARERGEENRFEGEDIEFHERVRQAYWALAEAAPGRYRIIETTGDIDATALQVLEAVAPLFDRG